MDKIIIAQDLSLGYNNQETIISKADFSINAGEFVIITGASGSGKSTLLKSFYGALEPLSGELMIGGVELNGITAAKKRFLRRNIGVVFQDYKLVREWTIDKNVTLPMDISGFSRDVCQEQATRLFSHVKLTNQMGKYPMELSGGEQQRVAMARALAHNPILILADEPTGNLDEYSSRMIWDLLEGSNTQLEATVVVVTHNIPSSLNIPYKHFKIEHGDVYEVT